VLASHPVLHSYAGEDPRNAAAVEPEAQNLGFVERWITGRPLVGGSTRFDWRGGHPEVQTYPTVLNSLTSRVLLNMRAAWEGLKVIGMERLIAAQEAGPSEFDKEQGASFEPPTAQDKLGLEQAKQRMAYYKDLAESPQTPAEAQSWQIPQKALRFGVEAAPLLVPYAGPVYFTLQTIGDLRAQGADAFHATTGGLVAGTAAHFMGEALQNTLLPFEAIKNIPKAVAAGAGKIALKPAYAKALLDYGQDVATAHLANTAMMWAQLSALRYSKAAQEGREVDPSELAQDGLQAEKASLEMLPYLGAFQSIGLAGKLWEAHANGLYHDMLTGPLQSTKLSTQELRDLTQKMSDNERMIRQLNIARGAIQESGGSLEPIDAAIAGVQTQNKVWINTERFKQVMQKAGQDPHEVAAHLTGRDGALRDAEALGGSLEMPLPNYLADLKDYHSDLRDGVAFRQYGATLAPNKGKWIEKDLAEALYNEQEGLPNAKGEMISAPPVWLLTPEQRQVFETRATPPDTASKGPAQGGDTPNQRIGIPPTDKVDFSRLPTAVVKAPALKALRMHAEEVVRGMSVGEIESGGNKFLEAAKQAAQKVIQLHQRAVNALGRAEQVAQQGLDTALEGIRKTNQGIKAGTKEADAALRSAFASAEERVRAEWERGHVVNRLQYLKQVYGTLPKGAKGYAEARSAIKEQITAERDRLQEVANKQKDPVVSAATGLYNVPQPPAPGGLPPSERNLAYEDARSIAAAHAKDASRHLQISKRLMTQRKLQAENAFEGAQDKSVRATEHTVKAGEALTEAQGWMDKRDLAYAVQREVEQQRAAIAKNRAYLTSAASEAARLQAYRSKPSHPEIGWGHDLILQSIGLTEPKSPVSDFSTVVQRLIDKGVKLEFDADKISELVQGKKEIADLKPDELTNVVRAMKQLAHIGQEFSQTYIEGAMRDRGSVIAGDIGPSVAKGAPPPKGGWGAALRELLGSEKREAQSSNFHTLLNPLGKWGREQALRWLTVRRNEDLQLVKVNDLFSLSKDTIKLGDQDVPHPQWMPDDARKIYGDALKRRDVWSTAMLAGSEEGLGALTRSWRATPEQIHAWLNEVLDRPEDWNIVKAHWQESKNFGDLEAAADSNRAGTPMEMKVPRKYVTPFGEVEGGYAPVRWYDKGQALPAAEALADPKRGVYAFTDVAHGFTKTQQEGVTGIIDPSFDRLKAHYVALTRDISRGDFVRDQARMLNDPRFRSTVGDKLGADYLKALDAWHNTLASGMLQNVTPRWFQDSLLAKARGVAARAVFQFNVKVLGGLGSHLPWAKSALGDMIDISAGMGKALDPEARRFAMDNSRVVPYRSDRVYQKLNESEAAILRDEPNRFERALRKPNQAMWHGADMTLTQIVWHGLHEVALRKGMLPKEALDHADLWTDRLMPAIDIYGKSLRATDPVLGTFFLVKNFESTVWNVKAMREWDSRAGLDQTAGGSPNLYAWKLGMAGALGLGHAVFYGHGRNEWEQKHGAVGWGAFAGRSLLGGLSYGNLFTHMAAQNLGQLYSGRLSDVSMFDTPEHEQISQFTRDLGKVVRAAEGRGQMTPALFAGMRAATRLLGGPTSVVKMVDGMVKVVRYSTGDNTFNSPAPVTPIGAFGKIYFGDVDKWESNLASEFDSLWRH